MCLWRRRGLSWRGGNTAAAGWVARRGVDGWLAEYGWRVGNINVVAESNQYINRYHMQ